MQSHIDITEANIADAVQRAVALQSDDPLGVALAILLSSDDRDDPLYDGRYAIRYAVDDSEEGERCFLLRGRGVETRQAILRIRGEGCAGRYPIRLSVSDAADLAVFAPVVADVQALVRAVADAIAPPAHDCTEV